MKSEREAIRDVRAAIGEVERRISPMTNARGRGLTKDDRGDLARMLTGALVDLRTLEIRLGHRGVGAALTGDEAQS